MSAISTAPITAPKQEEEEWKTQRDPVRLLADWMKKSKLVDAHLLIEIESEIADGNQSSGKLCAQCAISGPETK